MIQTRHVVELLAEGLPGIGFEIVPFGSPGDRDRVLDLRASPPDFFTRDLDEALRDGRIDGAIHSAKDLPDPVPASLDWCWLPWAEDPRDVLVFPPGRGAADLTAAPVIGVSSERREAYARRRFPGAEFIPVRGDIEDRLAQLDRGAFDVLLMAGAALVRLNLQERISEWIPLADLAAPEGQGRLALTFRAGDPAMGRVRSLFVKAVRFVGAGVGAAGNCTLAGRDALRQAEVCLHDTLMDSRLLDFLRPEAMRVDVGKRCGAHALPQEQITRLIADQARRGRRVVRLKGGDPGIFGRLAEEIELLADLGLPYRIIPGVSSMSVAAADTGILLTRRGVARGFVVMTPRGEAGTRAPVDAKARAALPLVLFMATRVLDAVAAELMADGLPGDTPAAVVLDAGGDDERVVRAPLAQLPAAVRDTADTAGLVMIGEICRYGHPAPAGALRGRRVLITASDALQDKAALQVADFGGIPIGRPLIRLSPRPEARDRVQAMADYDWVVLTSPSAVRCLADLLQAGNVDRRRIPQIMACGEGTAAELRSIGLEAEAVPDAPFGAESLLETARHLLAPGCRILRLRSDQAGPALADGLRTLGAAVDDCVLYTNVPLSYERCPACDAVFFASASAVEAFTALWGCAALAGKMVVVIGAPTAKALLKEGRPADLVAAQATVDGAITALAQSCVGRDLGAAASVRTEGGIGP